MKRLFLAAGIAALGMFHASPAQAAISGVGEAYAFPTYQDMLQTAVMLDGLDIRRTELAYEYIRAMYCPLYLENYKNDFAWSELVKQFTTRITSRHEYFRSLYQIPGYVQLEQYDFQREEFPIDRKTSFYNVGTFLLFDVNNDYKPYCDLGEPGDMRKGKDDFLPKNFSVTIGYPFTLTSLKMTPADAEKMIAMQERLYPASIIRRLYLRFRFRVQDIKDPLASKDMRTWRFHDRLEFRGDLVAVDLFYDRDMTIWAGKVPLK